MLKEALEKVKGFIPAVILLDIMMPEIDGYEVCQKIRSDNRFRHTKIILVSGKSMLQERVKGYEVGADDFVMKPFEPEELDAKVKVFLKLHCVEKELFSLNKNLERKVEERTQQILNLNKNLRKSLFGSIQLLSEISGMESSIIGSHGKRVDILVKEVTKGMELSENEIYDIEIAALIHDLGKIGMLPSILEKSEDQLKEGELKILESHPIKGESIARMVPNLGNIPKIIRHHHENFDGSGYPDGLKGHDIPVGSRVIAVLDSYDKVLNSRVSFETATPEKALGVVKEGCPKMFSPDVVTELALYIKQKRGGRKIMCLLKYALKT